MFSGFISWWKVTWNVGLCLRKTIIIMVSPASLIVISKIILETWQTKIQEVTSAFCCFQSFLLIKKFLQYVNHLFFRLKRTNVDTKRKPFTRFVSGQTFSSNVSMFLYYQISEYCKVPLCFRNLKYVTKKTKFIII